jgi:hypothetical protein
MLPGRPAQAGPQRPCEISCRHTDPEPAAKIVNTRAETLRLSNMERRADSSASSGDFLNNYSKNRQIISLQPENNLAAQRLAGSAWTKERFFSGGV